MPHDPDVKALLRMAVVWNIPIACNRASADFMISSPLMDGEYDRLVPDYEGYRTRKIEVDEESGQEEADIDEDQEVGQEAPDADEGQEGGQEAMDSDGDSAL
jgi:hypothetical protein